MMLEVSDTYIVNSCMVNSNRIIVIVLFSGSHSEIS